MNNIVGEKSGTKVDVDGTYDCENLCIVWKNVKKIRMREKTVGVGRLGEDVWL